MLRTEEALKWQEGREVRAKLGGRQCGCLLLPLSGLRADAWPGGNSGEIVVAWKIGIGCQVDTRHPLRALYGNEHLLSICKP